MCVCEENVCVCEENVCVCEENVCVCERRMYVCVSAKIYVCEWRMYVCESARMNYGLNGPSYIHTCIHTYRNVAVWTDFVFFVDIEYNKLILLFIRGTFN